MKNAGTIFVIVSTIFIAGASAVPLRADDTSVINMVTSGAWHIYAMEYAQGKGYTLGHRLYSAAFERDKNVTITRVDGSRQTLKWKISGNSVAASANGEGLALFGPLDPHGTKGSAIINSTYTPIMAFKAGNDPPKPEAVAPAQSPATALSPSPTPSGADIEAQKNAADFVSTYHDDLVFVTGKNGSGSGFIASISGGNFLVTNAHVVAGISDASFKTLDNAAVTGGAASVAVGEDIFCMKMAAGGKPLEVMQEVDKNSALGDYVVVLGNANGAGVVNTILGKIVGLGPDLVEVDAPFVHGNSGSPIIHLKSGKVIAVATYYTKKNYDPQTGQKLAAPVIRRFGYRLDSIKSWQAVDWRAFYAQAAEMRGIESFTDDMDHFLDELDEDGTISGDGFESVFLTRRIQQWQDDKIHVLSTSDTKTINAGFYSSIKAACQADVIAARQHIGYDYFRRELADEQKIRDEMSKALEGEITRINQ